MADEAQASYCRVPVQVRGCCIPGLPRDHCTSSCAMFVFLMPAQYNLDSVAKQSTAEEIKDA